MTKQVVEQQQFKGPASELLLHSVARGSWGVIQQLVACSVADRGSSGVVWHLQPCWVGLERVEGHSGLGR